MSLEHYHLHHRLNKLSRLRLALFLTGSGMVIEFAGGLLSNSLALVSDAWHMVTHLFALGMSYFAIVLALRPVTKQHTYGLYRAEILAAFINGIVLIFISGYLVYEAVMRFIHPEEVKILEMFLVAVIGLIINGASIYLLSRSGSHDLNIRSAILHEIGDLISSVAVVVGALFIFYTRNYLIDALLTFFIAILIVIWSIKLLVDSAHILLEAAPKHLDIDLLVTLLKDEIPGIHEVHHVHAWTIATSMYALTAHVVIDDCHVSKANDILIKVNDLLKKKFNIEHTNIQFECLIKKA
ncbi:MAG: cation diffusion facilitator family transporter [Candidatus Omnitrophota bacterium]